MSSKPKFPRAAAIPVAKQLCLALRPHTERLVVAGSLRRSKPEVGDIEILYIQRLATEPNPDDLFATRQVNHADAALDLLIRRGIITKRPNTLGHYTWGPNNKYAIHCDSGIPVDLFATTHAAWFNYLVCRTGPAESNERIATLARSKGWRWNPYGSGFTDLSTGEIHPVTSERDVFQLVGLDYLEPWDR